MADELNKDNTAENSANKENSYAAAKDLYEQHRAEKKKAKKSGVYTQFAAEQQDYTVLTDAADGNDIAVKDGNVIVIETGAYNPKLDPSSSEFDVELYEAKLKEHGKDITTIKDSLASSFEQLAERVKDVYTKEELQSALFSLGQTMQALQETIYPVVDGVKSIIGSESFHYFAETAQRLKENLPTQEQLQSWSIFNIGFEIKLTELAKANGIDLEQDLLTDIDEDSSKYDALIEQAEEYAAEFANLFEQELAKDKYKELSYWDIYNSGIEDNGILRTVKDNSTLSEIIETVLGILAATQTNITVTENGVEHIKFRPIKEIKTPLDKTNSLFYGISQPQPKKDINGQLQFIPVTVGNGKDGKQIAVYYSYFVDTELLDRLGISSKYTQKDFVISAVINSFRESGNDIITLSQLHKALGNKTRPNTTQLKKLADNLTRQLSTTIKLDTKDIAEAYNLENYNEFLGSLLPIQIVNEKKMINGQMVESYIKILAEPPLITLAKNTKQITAIPPQLLEVDETHNDMFYAVFNYLVTEIAHIKNPNFAKHNKILYSTLLKEVGVKPNDSKKKNRVLEITFNILKHFVACEYISGYKEETTASTGEVGVKIIYNSQAIETNKK